MTFPISPLPRVVLLAAVLAGCAGAPTTPPPAPAAAAGQDCRLLAVAIEHAQADRREAVQQQQDAWKVVLPFAVVARHASARSAIEDADRRVGELQAAFDHKGCTHHGS